MKNSQISSGTFLWQKSSLGVQRYGFNGMEGDDEVKGEGNSYDFGSRIYDPRVARWFTRDPKEMKYPNTSPFSSSMLNPIVAKDVDGEDVIVTIVMLTSENNSGHCAIFVSTYDKVMITVEENGKKVQKTYYTLSTTVPYVMAENIVGLETYSATITEAYSITRKNQFVENSAVVSYEMDKDQGILGEQFSESIKKLNPDLNLKKTYFLPEQVEVERKMLEQISQMKQTGEHYYHDLDENGEYIVNDCSTIIVELLTGAGLVKDPSFGLTTATNSGYTISTPTPTEISYDLEEMSKKDKSISQIVGREGDFSARSKEKAKAFLEKMILQFLDHKKEEETEDEIEIDD